MKNGKSKSAPWRYETLIRRGAADIPCVVHAKAAEWLLVEVIDEFHFNGFSLIADFSLKQRRYNQVDRTFEKIMREEGCFPSTPPLSIEGSDPEIFARLAAIDTFVIIESDDESRRFLIGTIHRITKTRLFVKHFVAHGKWWQRPTGIDFADIGRVSFCDEYSTVWSRYFRRERKAQKQGQPRKSRRRAIAGPMD